MDALPSRMSLVPDRAGAAMLGAVVPGGFDVARILIETKLFLSPGDRALLVVAAVVESAAIGLMAGALLSFFPPKPRGRSRWLGALSGAAAWCLAWSVVYVLTDPPPFTQPARFQGQPLALVAAAALAFAVVLGLYQGVRGARNISVAGAFLFAVGGVVLWTSLPVPEPVAASSAPIGARPNVLLVTLDTTRADRVGAYGNTDVSTPNIDHLADTGIRWMNASAVAAVTGPSHAAMLSGQAPWHSGVLLNGVPLSEDQELLAQRFADQGYSTAAFVSAYVLDGTVGFGRGFQVYDDEFSWLRAGSLLVPARFVAMLSRHADPDEVLERRGGDTVDLALRWLATRGDQPWFLWVHLFDAHGPYTPPPPFDTRYYSGDPHDPGHTSMRQVSGVAPYLEASLKGITDLDYVLAQYAGEISYADAQLGRLLAAVEGPNTLVTAIGDHGESLGEHGVWFNHGDDVYETSLHVPFVMAWPGHLPPSVLTSPVQGTDLATTILARLDLPPLGVDGMDAVAASREEAGSKCFDRATNLAERAAGRITQPKYRLAGLRSEKARFTRREFDSRDEYFQLESDFSGLNDAYPAMSQVPDGTALFPVLDARADAMFSGDTNRSAVELSAEERARLEALGYLDQ